MVFIIVTSNSGKIFVIFLCIPYEYVLNVSLLCFQNIHPNLLKSHVQSRINKVSNGTKIDWATAEAMAFGSLMHEGLDLRKLLLLYTNL